MMEDDYSYKGKQGTCAHKSGSGIVTNGSIRNRYGGTQVKANDVSAMKAASEMHVLSVAIEADKRVFQTYKSGIFSSTRCGT